MNVKTILLPTDFSPYSDAALEYASLLAAEYGAKLHILHVGNDSAAYMAGYGGFTQVPDLPERIERENRALLQGISPTATGVEFEHHYLNGIPEKKIVELADQEKVDLIVMGTHGRSGVSRLLMGSVAEGVLRHATCPVLTLKHPAAAVPEECSVQES